MRVQKKSDWIILDISQPDIDKAKSIRNDRDTQYGNRYVGKDTDIRWVGDLGEIIFKKWLDSKKCGNEWITENTAGKPDFILENGQSIGVKTVKRKVPPQLSYTAQITAAHAKEKVDWFLFMSCVLEQNKMWIFGAIQPGRFLLEAKYYGAGAKVHENYVISPGHEIYNIDLSKLEATESWLESIRQKPDSPQPVNRSLPSVMLDVELGAVSLKNELTLETNWERNSNDPSTSSP